MSLVYWATIIQQGAAQLERPLKIRCLQYSTISAVWSFYLLLSASTFLSKGFLTTEMTVAQMVFGVAFLLVVSTTFLVFGLRVMSRLRMFERQQQFHVARNQAFMDLESGKSPAGVDSARPDKTVFIQAGEYSSERLEDAPVPRKKSSHTTRIRNILLVVEGVAFFVAIAQVPLARVAVATQRHLMPTCTLVSSDLRGVDSIPQADRGAGLRERTGLPPRPQLHEHPSLVPGAPTRLSTWRGRHTHQRYGSPPSGGLHLRHRVGLPQHSEEGSAFPSRVKRIYKLQAFRLDVHEPVVRRLGLASRTSLLPGRSRNACKTSIANTNEFLSDKARKWNSARQS